MALLPTDPAKQKQVLIGIVPILLLFLYWYFPHAERAAQIEELEARLEVLETRNTTARALAARGGPELEQRLAIYEQHMARLEQLMPSREEVPGLLNAVTLRAQSAGVDLAGYRPLGEEAGEHYSKQTYDLIVNGPYHEIGEFLTAIGSLPRIITPVGLRIAPRAAMSRDGSQILNAVFRIETYVLPPPAAQSDEATTG